MRVGINSSVFSVIGLQTGIPQDNTRLAGEFFQKSRRTSRKNIFKDFSTFLKEPTRRARVTSQASLARKQ
jgi:hypothetical protein